MKKSLVFLLSIPLLLIPILAYASSSFSIDKEQPFVEIIVRDKDGHLVTYLEQEHFSYYNEKLMKMALDSENPENNIMISLNGEKYQVLMYEHSVKSLSHNVISNSKLGAYQEGIPIKAAELSHTGVYVVSGDEITSIWKIVMPLD